MKKIAIALLLVACASVVIAKVAPKKAPVDILIERVMGTYEKSVKDADAYYKKYTAPVQKRRDGKIVAAGDIAIKKLNSARRSVSEVEGIKLEQQIAVVRESLSEKVGNVSEVKSKVSVLAACGIKYKGHTYLAIASSVNWKEANLLCRKMGGHLVYIETVEEFVMMKRLFGTYRLWTGASKVKRQWKWGNGKSVDPKIWVKGYPKNYTYGVMHGELKDT